MKAMVEIHDGLARKAEQKMENTIEVTLNENMTLKDLGKKLGLPSHLIHVAMVNGKRENQDYTINDNDFVQLMPTVGTTEAEITELLSKLELND